MPYPYQEVEKAAKQNPPPEPQEPDQFPTVTMVIALYLLWIMFFGRKFKASEALPNAKQTIKRVSQSKNIHQLFKKWRAASTDKERIKYAALAWDSYQKNLWNTVSGTCAEAVAKRELAKLKPNDLIKWLPSVSSDKDLEHIRQYYKTMTVEEAKKKELCIRIGCKCGWLRVERK